jgi:hypothetical protein
MYKFCDSSSSTLETTSPSIGQARLLLDYIGEHDAAAVVRAIEKSIGDGEGGVVYNGKCQEMEGGDFGKIDSLLFILVNSCSCSVCQGFSKGTLHYMKKNAESDRPFSLNKHVKERLNRWDLCVKKKMEI